MTSQQNDIYNSSWSNQDLLTGLGIDFQEDLGLPSSMQSGFTGELSPGILASGELLGNTVVKDGYLQSSNFVSSSAGWQLTPTSVQLNVSTALLALDIPNTITANSAHIESDGDSFWGCNNADFISNNNNANAYILKTGVAKFQSATIADGCVIGSTAILEVEKGAIANWPSDANLAAYWSFDEGSGLKAIDGSKNGNDGTLNGTMTSADWIAGISGTMLDLDGTDDYISKANPSFINDTQGAVSMWVKIDVLTTFTALWALNQNGSNNDYFQLVFAGDSNKALLIYLANDTTQEMILTTAANIITDSLPHHIVLTSNGSTIKLYVDNVEKTLTESVGVNSGQWFASAVSVDQFNVGVYKGASLANYLNGDVDEVRIYSTALTAKEVYALNKGISGQQRMQPMDLQIAGWQFSGTFSSTDYRTVAWTSGSLILPNGTTYAITGANTGPISDLTYIYFDLATSTTAFQTTTTAATANGRGKFIVAVAQNNADTTSKASFQAYGGSGGQLLTVDSIAANSASVNEFISNSAQIHNAIITDAKIDTLTVSKLTAGTFTSKAITLAVADGSGDSYIAAGKTDFDNTQSGFILGIDDSDSNKAKFYIGDATTYLNWTGSKMNIKGNISIDSLEYNKYIVYTQFESLGGFDTNGASAKVGLLTLNTSDATGNTAWADIETYGGIIGLMSKNPFFQTLLWVDYTDDQVIYFGVGDQAVSGFGFKIVNNYLFAYLYGAEGESLTQIAGITLTVANKYRAEYDYSTSGVYFYVNNILKVGTGSYNLPTDPMDRICTLEITTTGAFPERTLNIMNFLYGQNF